MCFSVKFYDLIKKNTKKKNNFKTKKRNIEDLLSPPLLYLKFSSN